MLSAFALPDSDDYNYSWELVEDDDGDKGDAGKNKNKNKKKKSGSMQNPHDAMLTLTDLEEGVYKFKVTVSAGGGDGVPDRMGVAYTNVTVLAGRTADGG